MKEISSIFSLVGNTPLYKIKDTNIYVKLECFNPTGSVKDRAANQMLIDALESKKIDKNTTIIEPTSGNTGIALAAMCASLEMKCIIVMSESMTKERSDFIEAYGAKVIKTDASLGMQGTIDKAKELNKEIPNSYILDQFNNESNVLAHYNTTAREIESVLGKRIDFFVSGIGTGGTITGVAKYFKQNKIDAKIIGIEPETSSVIKNKQKGKHNIQGIGAGFIPNILDLSLIDDIYLADYESSLKAMKDFAFFSGILVGISSGAALDVSYRLKEEYGEDKIIVAILPDSGNRYFSILNLNKI